MITLRQSSKRTRYTFERSWGLAGGTLYGDNFITDICTAGAIDQGRPYVYCEDGVWIVQDCEGDPDFLLYLWKHGRGERVSTYVEMDELIYLYKFYSANGFMFMIPELTLAQSKNQTTCVIS